MEQEKLEILTALHDLLSHNVIGSIQYKNRYNGFTAELDFQQWFDLNRESALIEGGMFIPTVKSQNPFEHSVYFTCSESSPSEFIDIYSSASTLASKGSFFIKYDTRPRFADWERKQLFQSQQNGQFAEQLFHTPPFEVFEFNPKNRTFSSCSVTDISNRFVKSWSFLTQKYVPEVLKNHFIQKFQQFSVKSLLRLYVERLFFDGYLNLTFSRGAPLDIDSFVRARDGSLCLLEIKEKDVSKRDPKGFGMDLRRVDSLSMLSDTFSTRVFYVVRHVNNQTQRQFVNWMIIDLEKFKSQIAHSPTKEGGTGMRSISSHNPTKVCRLEHFQLLK